MALEQNQEKKRGPTSMFIDRTLWIETRKKALELEITTTEFVENALRKELENVVMDG